MANAKKCDICGKYYDTPHVEDEFYDQFSVTSMVRLLKLNTETYRRSHDVMNFDTCENCLQDILDYILTKKADAESIKEDHNDT